MSVGGSGRSFRFPFFPTYFLPAEPNPQAPIGQILLSQHLLKPEYPLAMYRNEHSLLKFLNRTLKLLIVMVRHLVRPHGQVSLHEQTFQYRLGNRDGGLGARRPSDGLPRHSTH